METRQIIVIVRGFDETHTRQDVPRGGSTSTLIPWERRPIKLLAVASPSISLDFRAIKESAASCAPVLLPTYLALCPITATTTTHKVTAVFVPSSSQLVRLSLIETGLVAVVGGSELLQLLLLFRRPHRRRLIAACAVRVLAVATAPVRRHCRIL